MGGYSERPATLIFELCEVNVHGTIVHNLSQLLSLFNEGDYFNFKESTDYLYQATEGLNYLHKNSIIHRDFKPSNLLVNGSLEKVNVKVADFDVVTKIKEKITATSTIHKFQRYDIKKRFPRNLSPKNYKIFKFDRYLRMGYFSVRSVFKFIVTLPKCFA